jgi:hypothetical protein
MTKTTHTLNMFADHWENPEGFESRFRDNPHDVLATYGIIIAKDVLHWPIDVIRTSYVDDHAGVVHGGSVQ